jgi:adenylate cyclase
MANGTLELPSLPREFGLIPLGWIEGTAPPSEYVLNLPIRFIGPPSHTGLVGDAEIGTFPAYAASTTPLVAPFMPDLFKDKIVLLGTASHDSDKFRTPFHGFATLDAEGTGLVSFDWMFGVEIHANALQNMLDQEYVRPLGLVTKLTLLLALSLLVAGTAFWRGAALGGAMAILAAGGILVAAFWTWTGEAFIPGGTLGAFAQPYLVIPVVTPALAVFLSYLGSVAYVSIVEGKDKRFIKSAFGMYVSPDVVNQIAVDPDALRLGGQKRKLSILFSDLAGFTDLSETLDPGDLISLLNEYLSDMTRLVLDEGGTLDKYIGDAIMAFWNAPADVPDHADRALRCAVVMQRRMRKLNEEWATRDPDHRTMKVRIGINTGEVVVGNVGGKEKFDYSAIGDAVNLAARLEPANKTYRTLTMASEFTVAEAEPGAFRLRKLDRIAVKGKVKPVTVYEVLEEAGVQVHWKREEAIAQFDAGLRTYLNRDWEGAAGFFAAALVADPDDGPSAVYLERARRHAEDPPPEDWDFVERRTTK